MAAVRGRLLHYLILVVLLLTSSKAETQIRLVGHGSSRCSGRVEVYYNNSWGTVCRDYWGLSDGEVLCREMNCGRAVEATRRAEFGEGTGEIWLDNVQCSGNESSLTECRHGGFGKHNCGHDKDAGVVCSGGLPKPSISVTPLVTWSQNVSVTCRIEGLSGGTFILKNLNQNIQTSNFNPTIFNLPPLTFNDDGYYYCVYQIDKSNQTYVSPQSDFVRLCVTVPFLWALVPAVVGGLLVLLLLFVVVCLLHQRRSVMKCSKALQSSNRLQEDGICSDLEMTYSDDYETISKMNHTAAD